MQIILLDELKFDAFAINHPNYNFYQSSNYGKFMSKHGYNSYYLGLSDDVGNIKAATLIIVKNDKSEKRKMGYAPRGFLIDWSDSELVREFTTKIKEFLAKRSFTYLKVDPMIVYKEYNSDGSLKYSNSDDFVKKMQSLGYTHMGYNNGMEASKPRWNSIIKLDPNIISLYNSLSKEARYKIKKAAGNGFKVYKGSNTDISLFYNVLNRKNPPLEYYMDLYQFFNVNNGFEIYFVKLEPVSYVNSSKKMYEEEEQRNSNLNMQMQDFNNPNKDAIINEKLKSDEMLATYKKNMLEAINLFQKYPSGIIIAALAVIKYGKKVTFFVGASDEDYKNDYPDYLLRWQLAEYFSRGGYESIDYNGMMGMSNTDYDTTLKKELTNSVVEYVGEFDLVINKKTYYTGSKLNPILNWLNTPI